jgi:hypothetical protein
MKERKNTMTTPVSQPDEQTVNAMSAGQELQAAVSSQSSASQPMGKPPEAEDASQSPFFYIEDEPLDDLETPYVAPFPISGALPISGQAQSSSQGAAASSPPLDRQAPTTSPKRWLALPVIAILVCIVVIVGLLAITALAQTTPPLQTNGTRSSRPAQQPATSGKGKQQQPTTKPPSSASMRGTNGQGLKATASHWIPQPLLQGWTQAGLSTGDAIQALRTATTFTDREMSLDYRSVGTRNTHGGTFTAATFLLTPAAQQRFLRNDVRAFNNTLFDQVQQTRLIRLVIDPQPQLLAFSQQGQQQFAWVTVTFQVWQSQLDPNHPGQRLEGVEIDPATKQPRLHQMMVLLLRVPQQDAGADPAMGGTGWLVSNYGLDVPTPLTIVQPA